MFKHFEDPKPGYVADWPELPGWQQETGADVSEAIEREAGDVTQAALRSKTS